MALADADHLLAQGKDGNVEIVQLHDLTEKVKNLMSSFENPFIIFTYRFIKYQYNFEIMRFEPIILDTNLPYNELRERYVQPKSPKERELSRLKFGECIVDVPKATIF